MHHRFIAVLISLIVLLALCASGLMVVYGAKVRPIEAETCPAVERYFAAEREAYATLNTNELQAAATGGQLQSISALVEPYIATNHRLYLTTTIDHCSLAFPLFPDESFVRPSAGEVSLNVGYTTQFGTDPDFVVSEPVGGWHWDRLFLVMKVDDTWKVSAIVSPQ